MINKECKSRTIAKQSPKNKCTYQNQYLSSTLEVQIQSFCIHTRICIHGIIIKHLKKLPFTLENQVSNYFGFNLTIRLTNFINNLCCVNSILLALIYRVRVGLSLLVDSIYWISTMHNTATQVLGIQNEYNMIPVLKEITTSWVGERWRNT